MEPACKRLHMIAQQIAKPEPLVLYESTHGLLSVTLNRPKALNSLNLSMIDDLSSHLDTINQHQAVWMQGAGGKSFCAGGDVKVLFEKGSKVEDRLTFFRREFTLDYRMSQLKAVQIACWDGYVMGGGVGLSAFAPVIIATEKTAFAMPETKLGFFTDVGANYILSRLRNNIGYYLGMTGSILRGEDVYLAGLAHYYIPSERLKEVHQDLKDVFSEKVTQPKDVIDSILKKYHAPSGKTSIQNEQAIKELFSLQSGRQIFEKATTKDDEFHKKVVKAMGEVCPVSIELVWRLITRTKKMTVKECFINDFEVIEHMVVSDDFKEGVRCVLMEKGAKANWSAKDLSSLKEEQVQLFLKPTLTSEPLILE